jgi:hypothetical protein
VSRIAWPLLATSAQGGAQAARAPAAFLAGLDGLRRSAGVRKRQRFVIPRYDEGVKALKQCWSGSTVGPPYPPLDYSRF